MNTSTVTTAASLENVAKIFNQGATNEFVALEDVSLDIAENEFFTLLGPSGCGKTTLLRILAGFEHATRGSVEIFGDQVAHLPPNRRPVNTVFQHYALFPHLSVYENVGFALKMQGVDKAEINKTANEMLALVHMDAFADRKPDQLSGGQKQRVALARALAPHPKILLLDEPLSALDLKLRQAMRWELKALQRETGITFVFVTHDQDEALTMSDRIAVISQGHVQQLGSPTQIYEYPENRFVADFIGESNLIDIAIISAGKGIAEVEISDAGKITVETDVPLQKGDKATLSIRPERIVFYDKKSKENKSILPATVLSQAYLGNANEFRLTLGNSEIVARAPQGGVRGQLSYEPGTQIAIGFEPDAIRILRS